MTVFFVRKWPRLALRDYQCVRLAASDSAGLVRKFGDERCGLFVAECGYKFLSALLLASVSMAGDI